MNTPAPQSPRRTLSPRMVLAISLACTAAWVGLALVGQAWLILLLLVPAWLTTPRREYTRPLGRREGLALAIGLGIVLCIAAAVVLLSSPLHVADWNWSPPLIALVGLLYALASIRRYRHARAGAANAQGGRDGARP